MPETQASRSRSGILSRIVETKRDEVRVLQGLRSRVLGSAEDAPPARDFWSALRRPQEVALIAEVKRRSPGAGDIRTDLDPVALARAYETAGASALSVLTDRDYFGGSLEDLAAVKRAVSIPILRKDFLIDPLQVAEARGAGADAVLLIVRILDDDRLAELLDSAAHYGLAALVEVHDAPELERAAHAGARIVGINNRDLSTFGTDLDVTVGLLGGVPAGALVVSESGIRSREDVERLAQEGVDAVLVGEALLRAEDPGEAARTLVAVPRREKASA